MKNEQVKDWMTSNPVTIAPDASLPDAFHLMREQKIRRLPVVDGHGHLVGIISITDVKEATPSNATTLTIAELNFLLSKLEVKRIMTKDVLTIKPDDSIADAARTMLDYKIGGLPVIENAKLVGILTESDIFRGVVKLYAEG